MNIIKSLSKSIQFVACALSMSLMVLSCANNELDEGRGYGYVQFRLFKAESYTKSTVEKLAFLSDACKIQVKLRSENGMTIEQTLVLNSFNAENAEYGLRSDKLKLVSGEYEIFGYNLYDRVDELLYTGTVSESFKNFRVISDGLQVCDLTVNAMGRGKVEFRLLKSLPELTKADYVDFPFSKIRSISLSLTNLDNGDVSSVKKLPVSYVEEYKAGSGTKTSYADCDSTLWIEAGRYKVTSFTCYSDKKGKTLLGTANTDSPEFTVSDNSLTKAEVSVRFDELNESLKDYLALKEIWEALGGPQWSYYGEALPKGCNWNFNKDIDLWGEQPGVSLDDNGRVIILSVSGFGARGVVPDAIGQLTKLQILALGTHDESYGGQLESRFKANLTDEQMREIRLDYDTRFLARDSRESLTPELRDAINDNPSMTPVLNNRIFLKGDVATGTITNGITSISRAIMRLTNLQQLYIANSPIENDGFWTEVSPDSEFYSQKDTWSWSNMTNLTDVEIYNCPKITALPMDMLGSLPELVQLNVSRNKGIRAEQLKEDWSRLADADAGKKIQMLYLGFNNLTETPGYEQLNKMVKLKLLDLQDNSITTLHPFGKEVSLVKLYLNNNKVTTVPSTTDGFFFGYSSETESISFAHNQITEFPDIFNAKSNYIVAEVDFSYNQISSFENGDNARGVNASTVNLSYNRLETFPGVLFAKGSPINTLQLAGNGMKSIPKGSMTGSKSHYLSVIDLSYNKLSSLPDDFLPTNVPYLYGIDLNYNCFSKFPYNPLNCDRLDYFSIRHQRDDAGNRILKTWPTGLYQCPSLTRFFIGSNDLRKIDDKFTTRLRILEIADNPNISVDLSAIAAYIKVGYIMLIYDDEQDIRGL